MEMIDIIESLVKSSHRDIAVKKKKKRKDTPLSKGIPFRTSRYKTPLRPQGREQMGRIDALS